MDQRHFLEEAKKCQCGEALKYAVITDKTKIPAGTKRKLACIVGKSWECMWTTFLLNHEREPKAEREK